MMCVFLYDNVDWRKKCWLVLKLIDKFIIIPFIINQFMIKLEQEMTGIW